MRPPTTVSTAQSAALAELARSARRRAALQFGYLLVFAGLALMPNLLTRPSLLLLVCAALALCWLLGCLGVARGLSHADELMLCGCTAPLVLGVAQLVYRIDFIWTHRGLTHPGIPESAAAAFAAVWAVELFAVLLPALVFLYLNARSLTPVLPPAPGVMRPSSRKRRT
jgi:hypothetical protein